MGVLVEPPSDPLLGRTLMDRYLVERKLGEGGMGAVYVARHLVLDKPIALKVLHPELVRKPELRERFLNEARAASRIRHENVIDITDFGTTPEGAVFFAMELLNGRDLHAELVGASGNGLPWSRARAIFLQVCSALSSAHRLGIIHRDLKPENIYLIEWLGHRDFVKLLDFGIAKSTEVPEQGVGEPRKLTRTGMVFGTPEYMAPEQARGETPDQRVDVYAMGCILYHLVTGRVPFTGDSFMAVLAQHLSQPVPTIGRDALEAVGAPLGLEEVVERALAKERDERYPSIEALASALRAAEDASRIRRPSAMSGPATVPDVGPILPMTPMGAPERSPRRGRVLALVGVALAAIAIGITAAALATGSGDAEDAPDLAAPVAPAKAPRNEPPPRPGPDIEQPAPADEPATARPERRERPRRPARPRAKEAEPRLGDVETKDPFDRQ